MTFTPNMLMPLPDDHGDSDLWGVLLNDLFYTYLDAHDHSIGKGALVPSSGLKINADLAFNFGGISYAITSAKATQFTEVTTASVAGYSSAFFVNSADHELYFRNRSGTNVKMTSGSTLNISVVGGIGGDYASVGALFSFDDSTDRYLAQQQGSPRPWAGMALGNLDLYQQTTGIVNRVRLQSPNSLAASYALTFPGALPGAQTLLQCDSAGLVSASDTLTGTRYVAHGNYKRALYFHPTLGEVIAGTCGNTFAAGSPTPVIGNSSDVRFYLPALSNGQERLKSITVYTGAAGAGTKTVKLQLMATGGSFTDVTGAVLTTTSNTAPITLTPTTPALLADGESYFLRFTTDGSSTFGPPAAFVTYDKP